VNAPESKGNMLEDCSILPRRLILLLDGTWNHPDQKDRGKVKPSNVTKLARAIRPVSATDQRHQISYYDDGVGTSYGLDRWIGGGLGVGLARNVREAYRFLMYNYHQGDDLFIFGFSRGAWTARSLVGFVNRFGVLDKSTAFYANVAYELYEKHAGPDKVSEFLADKKRATPRVHFIGVWDTVGSIGLPTKIFHRLTRNRWNYHDVSLAPCIRHAVHALAIDERRKPFFPTLWMEEPRGDQTLEQRWFAGVHSNIGGGYKPDGLANCALHWIAQRATEAGLDIDRAFLAPFKAYWGDELRNTYTGFYRMLGPAHRPIGTTKSETVDISAYRRYLNPSASPSSPANSYRPANLETYLKRRALTAEGELARLTAANPQGATSHEGARG
jgi:uncharacterized protein (DUF2235 family)